MNTKFKKTYPVCTPVITSEDKEAVCATLDQGWVSSEGPDISAFEKDFASYLGVSHGIAVSSGTSALEVAMYAIGLKEGDEVIMPSFTIISCALAVTKFGARPVLIDIEDSTWNINVELVESCITENTRAILAVHMYGHSCEILELRRIADKRGIFLIEDASQVHGGSYQNQMLGGFGDLGTFSFYANKLITTGEGGMVLGNSLKLINRAKSYRNLCFDGERNYIHQDKGANFRMTNMQAALGRSQLTRLDGIVEKKRLIGNWYRKYLGNDSRLRGQIEKNGVKSVYWMNCFVINENLGFNSAILRKKLEEKKVGCRAFFTGLHRQPCLKNQMQVKTSMTNTDIASMQGFYLPSGINLEKDDIKEISKRVIECLDSMEYNK